MGGVAQTVTVVGVAAPIDTTTSTMGATIDGDFARAVPVGRRVSDVTYMSPGVSSSGGRSAGTRRLAAAAASTTST